MNYGLIQKQRAVLQVGAPWTAEHHWKSEADHHETPPS